MPSSDYLEQLRKESDSLRDEVAYLQNQADAKKKELAVKTQKYVAEWSTTSRVDRGGLRRRSTFSKRVKLNPDVPPAFLTKDEVPDDKPFSLGLKKGPWIGFTLFLAFCCGHAIFLYAQLGGGSKQLSEPKLGQAAVDPMYWSGENMLFIAYISFKATINPQQGCFDVLSGNRTRSVCPSELYDSATAALCPPNPNADPVNCDAPGSQSLCTILNCKGFYYQDDLINFSYLYSVYELWNMKIVKDGKDTYPARAAAALLFIFSFIWPHVKLLILQFNYWFPLKQTGRRNSNYWVAVFGKWSFMDVLVMAMIIAIFDIVLSTDIPDLWDQLGLSATLVDKCADVSGFAFPSADPTQIFCNAYESSNLPNKPELCDAFCEPVINLVNEVVDAQLMGTQLEATIRMNGLNCMYAFCGAVVFSLILGVVCDYIDDDYRRHREVRPKLSHYIDLVHLKDGLSDDWHLGGVLGLGMLRSPLSFLHLTLLIITLVFEILICVTPMTFRQLGGSLGDELATHGINFDRNYTILQITWLLGSFGGLNILKSVVMFIFCVVGPLLRTGTQLMVLACPMPLRYRWFFHEFSRYMSIFFAYEVLVLSGPILAFTLTGVTEGLLTPGNLALCGPLNEKWDTGTCFELTATMVEGYTYVIIAVVFYAISGYDGAPTHKWMHSIMEPEDNPPPTCNFCKGCCCPGHCCKSCEPLSGYDDDDVVPTGVADAGTSTSLPMTDSEPKKAGVRESVRDSYIGFKEACCRHYDAFEQRFEGWMKATDKYAEQTMASMPMGSMRSTEVESSATITGNKTSSATDRL